MHLHTTLVLNAEGLPLGAHAAKTQQWINGLHYITEAATHLSRKTHVICVMDREADHPRPILRAATSGNQGLSVLLGQQLVRSPFL